MVLNYIFLGSIQYHRWNLQTYLATMQFLYFVYFCTQKVGYHRSIPPFIDSNGIITISNSISISKEIRTDEYIFIYYFIFESVSTVVFIYRTTQITVSLIRENDFLNKNIIVFKLFQDRIVKCKSCMVVEWFQLLSRNNLMQMQIQILSLNPKGCSFQIV